MADRRRKIKKKKKKKHWLKRTKAVPKKTKLGPEYKWFKISYLQFFFWKYYFGRTILVRTFQWTSSEFFLFQNLSQKISEPIKTSKKITHFTIQFRSRNLTHFMNLSSFEIGNNMPPNTAKKLSQFTNFPAKMFLFGVRKYIFTAPFPDGQELLSWSTLKANICIFLYISLKNFLFQRDFIWWYGEWGEAE